MHSVPPVRQPRLVMVPIRALLVTFLVTLLSFAVCLLASIVGAVVYSRVKGVPVSLTSAHGIIAVPVALTIGAVVLVLVLVIEIRSYRQAKALTAIERASRDVPG